jgi:broad specificity phosphatase PhoE
MRLILVRHAEPAWPEDRSHEDAGLTDFGRLQAASASQELAQRFAPAESVTAVLSSPARRAEETASVIAATLGQTLTLDEALAGLSRPDLRRKVYETGADAGLLAYATAIQERAWDSVQRLNEAHEPDASVIAVSHDITIAALVCRTLDMPIEDMRRFRIDLASITILSFTPRRSLLSLLNETCHLAQDA